MKDPTPNSNPPSQNQTPTLDLNRPIDDDLMLTTLDNPYNPHNEFKKWYQWDVEQRYNTSEYIARLANYQNDDSDEALASKYSLAVMEILMNDNYNVYRLIKEDDEIHTKKQN